jgi:16S rRNA processing protein RimM
LIALGYVTGTHGLKGAVRVKQHNADSELLFQVAEIALRQDGELRVHALAEVHDTPKGVLMRFEDVATVDAAASLRGAELCLPRSLFPPLEPGEFYHVDLEGLPVFTPDDQQVGSAERVLEYPAASVLCVRGQGGVWEVPMREPYLISVDLEQGRIVVDALADLDLQRD